MCVWCVCALRTDVLYVFVYVFIKAREKRSQFSKLRLGKYLNSRHSSSNKHDITTTAQGRYKYQYKLYTSKSHPCGTCHSPEKEGQRPDCYLCCMYLCLRWCWCWCWCLSCCCSIRIVVVVAVGVVAAAVGSVAVVVVAVPQSQKHTRVVREVHAPEAHIDAVAAIVFCMNVRREWRICGLSSSKVRMSNGVCT